MDITEETATAAGEAAADAYRHWRNTTEVQNLSVLVAQVADAVAARVAPLIAAQALQPVERGVQDALDWVVREYRQCIVSARVTHDSGHYEKCNGRAEAYRQLGTLVATGARLTVPDWEAIKAEVPGDGIYR